MILQGAIAATDDPVATLSQMGIFTTDSAVYYLSPCQLECILSELAEMEETLAVEVTAWTLSYRLGRARIANNKF